MSQPFNPKVSVSGERMRMRRLLVTLACLFMLTGIGCSPKEERSQREVPQQATRSPQEPVIQPSAVDLKEVVIEANDAMKFNVTDFSVRPGQQIRVTLRNVGTMPKLSMGHDWVLLKLGTDAAAFVEAGFAHASTDYIDPAKKIDVIAATRLLGPGESDTASFTAPKQTGTYNFVCTFPGHYAAGMKGTMSVE